MERYATIIKEQLKHNMIWQTAISLLILLLSPLVLGIENLDAGQTAKVLEMYVAVIGIILFIPIFQPEQDRDLRDLIQSKYTRITEIYSIRFLLALFVSILFSFGYLMVMKHGNCEMEVGKFFFGILAEMIAFGGIGVLAYAVSDNMIIGYMASIVYYIAGYAGGIKNLGKVYPFGMMLDYSTKYVIFIIGIICFILGIAVRGKKQR